MEETKIEAGSVVVLNSGGPKMTVGYLETTDEKTWAMCYWINYGARPTFWKFPLPCLTLLTNTQGEANELVQR